MMFLVGVFGGAVVALTITIAISVFWPKQLKSFLFPRDDSRIDFSRGTIYRKGQAPERVG